MTPKEKAKELVSKFTFLKTPEDNTKLPNAKQCALICVDEILEAEPLSPSEGENTCADAGYVAQGYWKNVKEEIQKL